LVPDSYRTSPSWSRYVGRGPSTRIASTRLRCVANAERTEGRVEPKVGNRNWRADQRARLAQTTRHTSLANQLLNNLCATFTIADNVTSSTVHCEKWLINSGKTVSIKIKEIKLKKMKRTVLKYHRKLNILSVRIKNKF